MSTYLIDNTTDGATPRTIVLSSPSPIGMFSTVALAAGKTATMTLADMRNIFPSVQAEIASGALAVKKDGSPLAAAAVAGDLGFPAHLAAVNRGS